MREVLRRNAVGPAALRDAYATHFGEFVALDESDFLAGWQTAGGALTDTETRVGELGALILAVEQKSDAQVGADKPLRK